MSQAIFGAKEVATVYGPAALDDVSLPGFSVPDNWMLQSVDVGGDEQIDVRKYFGGATRIFAYGLDQSTCTLTAEFLVMLGEKCDGGAGDGLESMAKSLSALGKGGISSSPTAGDITIGKLSLKGWLVRVRAGNVDPSRYTGRGIVTCLVDINSLNG